MFTLIKNYRTLFLSFVKNQFGLGNLNQPGEPVESTNLTETDFDGDALSDLNALRKVLKGNHLDSREARIISENVDKIDGEAKEGLKEAVQSMMNESFSAVDENGYNSYRALVLKTGGNLPTWQEIYDVLDDKFGAVLPGRQHGIEVKSGEVAIKYDRFLSKKDTLVIKLDDKGNIEGKGVWEEREGEEFSAGNMGVVEEGILDDNIVEYKEKVERKEIFNSILQIIEEGKVNTENEGYGKLLESLGVVGEEVTEEQYATFLELYEPLGEERSILMNGFKELAKQILDYTSLNGEEMSEEEAKQLMLKLDVESVSDSSFADIVAEKTRLEGALEGIKARIAATTLDNTTSFPGQSPEEIEAKRSERVKSLIERYTGGAVGTEERDLETKYEANPEIKELFETTINVSRKTTMAEMDAFEAAMDGIDSSVVDTVSDALVDAYEWTAEQLADIRDYLAKLFSEPDMGTFVGINGSEVTMEYDPKTGMVSADTSFFDTVLDFEVKALDGLIAGEDGEIDPKEVKRLFLENKASYEKAYNSRVMTNAIDKALNSDEKEYLTVGQIPDLTDPRNAEGYVLQEGEEKGNTLGVKLIKRFDSDGELKGTFVNIDTLNEFSFSGGDNVRDEKTEVLVELTDDEAQNVQIVEAAIKEAHRKYKEEYKNNND